MPFSQGDGIFMNKIKEFFLLIWYYVTYPFVRKRNRKIDEKLREIAREDMSKFTEKDEEFLKSVGVNIDSENIKK